MDYFNLYDGIVGRAIDRPTPTEYTEKHHIEPKCMGGGNEESNIVVLTAREHFLAHWLLCKMYPDNLKLAHAWNFMCISGSRYKGKRYTSHSFKYARENRAKKLKGTTWKMSDEGRAKISAAAKKRVGALNNRYGATLTDEHKEAILKSKFKGLWIVNGNIYKYAAHAAKQEGVPRTTLVRKCKSDKYPEFKFIPKEDLDSDKI